MAMPTRGLQVFACNTAFRIVSRKRNRFLYAQHTPARTLVMSRIRIPANGSVGESAAAVARPLQSEQFEPLGRMRDLKCLTGPRNVLKVAMMHRTQDAEVVEKKKRKTRKSLSKSFKPSISPQTSAAHAESFRDIITTLFSKCPSSIVVAS